MAIIEKVLTECGGVLFNKVGDGAWSFFNSAEKAVRAAVMSQRLVAQDNRQSGSNVRLAIRAGVHFGPTLQDGTELAGHSVNLCARITDIASTGEITISKETFSELSSELRGMCGEFITQTVKGITQPVDITFVEWRTSNEPARVFIKEMELEVKLDRERSVLSIGRQKGREGRPGNDVVIRLPDPAKTNRISRFQAELRWSGDGLELKSATDQPVVVDGCPLQRNDAASVVVGSQVILSDVVNSHCLSMSEDDSEPSNCGATIFFQTRFSKVSP